MRSDARSGRGEKGRPGDGVPSGSGGQDIRSPVLSSVSSGTPNANDATITWTTNVAADSQVFWGLTTAYAGASSPIIDYALVTSHSVLIDGLTSATEYHYKVLSRRSSGAYAFSADGTFTTA